MKVLYSRGYVGTVLHSLLCSKLFMELIARLYTGSQYDATLCVVLICEMRKFSTLEK